MKSGFLLVILSLGLNASAWAGGRDSGGGNAAICFKTEAIAEEVRTYGGISDRNIKEIVSIQMLDLLEAQKPVGFDGKKRELIATSTEQSITDFTKQLLARLYQFPGTQKDLAGVMNILTLNKTKHEVFGVSAVNDHAYRNRIGRNCAIVTVIAQQGTDRYTEIHLDDRIFSHPAFSDLNKKVAYAHEIFYYMARNYRDHKNSRNTQLFISKLLLKDLQFTELVEAGINLNYFTNEDIISYYKLNIADLKSLYLTPQNLGFSFNFGKMMNVFFTKRETFINLVSDKKIHLRLWNSGMMATFYGNDCRSFKVNFNETMLKYYDDVKNALNQEQGAPEGLRNEIWNRFSELTKKVTYSVQSGAPGDCAIYLEFPLEMQKLIKDSDLEKYGSPVVPEQGLILPPSEN